MYILRSTYAAWQRRLELILHQVGDLVSGFNESVSVGGIDDDWQDCDVFDIVSYAQCQVSTVQPPNGQQERQMFQSGSFKWRRILGSWLQSVPITED